MRDADNKANKKRERKSGAGAVEGGRTKGWFERLKETLLACYYNLGGILLRNRKREKADV